MTTQQGALMAVEPQKPTLREIEDAVQQAALRAWRIDQDRKHAVRRSWWRKVFAVVKASSGPSST